MRSVVSRWPNTPRADVLLEFKRREGLSEVAGRRILAYDYFYGQSRSLGRSDLARFLIGASTPNPDLLRALGYRNQVICSFPAGYSWDFSESACVRS